MGKVNVVFLFLALLTEIIGTIGGFGSSVFFVPLGNFYFDFNHVLGITALFHIASNLSKIALFRKGMDKRLVLYLGIPAIFFVIMGGVLVRFFNVSYLEVFLGVFLVGLSLLFLLKQNLVIPSGKKEAMVGGALSGLFAGLLGTGGAIRGLTMAAFNLEKSVFIATSAFIDFGIDFSRTIVYYFNGFIYKEDLIYIPFLVLIGWVGSYVGKLVLNYIPQSRFKKLSLLLILGIGVLTLARAILPYL